MIELETVLSSVSCIGNETELLDCPLIHSPHCSTEENAVVLCHGERNIVYGYAFN